MRIFRAPVFVQAALRTFAAKIWGTSEPPAVDPIVIFPDEDDAPSDHISYKIREWRACGEETQDELAREVRRAFDSLGRHFPSKLKEAATGDWLIEPMLRALGYYAIPQVPHGDNRLDYKLDEQTALEIKSNDVKHDDIGGSNDTARFRTVAEQIVTYLDDCTLKTMLYSNGFFWWRIERSERHRQLHALRFNMRRAYNEIVTHGTMQNLSRFTPLFHRKAFLPGNNYSIGIHQGLGRRIEPVDKVGLVWMKDLNNGYQNPGL